MKDGAFFIVIRLSYESLQALACLLDYLSSLGIRPVTIILSPEQIAAKAAAKLQNSNLLLEAVAGAGKTFTLLEILKILKGSVAFTAFNKAIAKEIEAKTQSINLDCKVGTIHQFGFGALRRAFKNIKVDEKKLYNLAREEFTGTFEHLRPVAIKGAEMAKNSMPETHDDWISMFDNFDIWNLCDNKIDAISSAQHLLKVSNSVRNIIDFSDMIYLPVILNLKIWQYDVVLLDEAQDTNAARRNLIKKLIKPNGILIAVGDPRQAIYGFTGADADAFSKIKEEFNTINLPLTTTYRCPKIVVAAAQRYVSDIHAHESAPDGIEDYCTLDEVSSIVKPNDAIICRNTKPLIEMAYNLIRKEIPARVEGRKIGEGLIKIVEKWKKLKTVEEFSNKLNSWSEMEIEKYKKQEKNSLCQELEDKVETLRIFIDKCDPMDDIKILKFKISSLFEDNITDCVVLSTIHKSKGREWDRVFTLGMNKYSPSKWAQKEWELVQENNLCYVQLTRAKKHLTHIQVKDS